jgi:hypothetical protein
MKLLLIPTALQLGPVFLPLTWAALVERQASPISLVTQAEWNQLKTAVGGRL